MHCTLERRLRAAIYSMALVVLAGCAAKDNVEPPADLVSFTATLRVQQAWSAKVGEAVGRLRLALAPAVDGERVYAAGRGGRVSAYTMESGRRVWTRSLRVPLSAGPGFGDGMVVVASSDGEVIALAAGDGSELWRTRVSSEVLAAPAVGRNLVAVRTIDGRLHALDAADGHSMWTYEQPTPPLTLRGSSAPVTAGDLIIAGYDNGRLVASHVRDGQPVWETPVATPGGRTEVERMVDINAAPRIVGRDLYVVSFQGRLAALAVESGRVLWSHPMSSWAGLGTDSLAVYVTDADGEVWAYDRLGGASLWHQPALRARSVTAPVAHGDAVAVGDYDGYLHWLSKDTGEFVARARPDSRGVQTAPVVFGRMLFVQGGGGTLTAYRVAD